LVIDFSNNDTWGNTLFNQNKYPMNKTLSKKCNVGDLCPNCKGEVLSTLSKHFSNVIKVYLVCTKCGSKKNEKLLNQYK
jgi:C4-type Zn-finger protein